MATAAEERVQVPVVTQAPQVIIYQETELAELLSSKAPFLLDLLCLLVWDLRKIADGFERGLGLLIICISALARLQFFRALD